MKRDKENILIPQVDLQPVIRAYRFLFRQLSMLLPFAHSLPVFPLLFWDNTTVDHSNFESSRNASYADPNEDAASRFPGKPGSTGVPEKITDTGQEPALYNPGLLRINTQPFHQDQKNREEISTPGHTVLIEPHIYSMRFLIKYVKEHFPGFDSSPASLPAWQPEHQQTGRVSSSHKTLREEKYLPGNFNGNRSSLSLLSPVIGIPNMQTLKIKENDTTQGQQNLLPPVPNHISRSSTEVLVIEAFKNVRFVNRVVQEAQNQRQFNVYSQEKMGPGSTIIDENKQEYGIGLTPLYTVNRSLGFLNEFVQPTVVQVKFQEDTTDISHPAAEDVYIDRVDRLNHVNYLEFLPDKVSRSSAQFTSIQDKTGNQNTLKLPYDPVKVHQTGVHPAVQYIPMLSKHFLETRRVDTAAGASGMFVRMKTYNIAPSLTSLAAAGNYLQTHLVNPVSRDSHSLQPQQQQHIQSHQHNQLITPQHHVVEELHRHVHKYGHELSTAVIVEKIYKPQFANGSTGSDANLNFSHSRDNQNQEVTNTFNVTMNVDTASPWAWDRDSLQDLGEKLTELLKDEARRYGIKT